MTIEQRRDNSKLIEIAVERISVKTQKLSIRTMDKRRNIIESKFPSRLKLFERESDLVDCNMFLEDSDEHNATKILI